MATILPPNQFDSGASVALSPDEAAASQSSQAPGAAADIAEPTSNEGRHQGSPAPGQELFGAGDLVEMYGIDPVTLELMTTRDEYERQLGLIREIFVGARKLNLPRFKLDEERFMLDLEEPPLFLRQARA